MQWKEHLSVEAHYTVQEVIERAINVSSFYTALMNVAGARTGGTVSNDAIGTLAETCSKKNRQQSHHLTRWNRSWLSLWKLIQR